jgi:hypothetical protein
MIARTSRFPHAVDLLELSSLSSQTIEPMTKLISDFLHNNDYLGNLAVVEMILVTLNTIDNDMLDVPAMLTMPVTSRPRSEDVRSS